MGGGGPIWPIIGPRRFFGEEPAWPEGKGEQYKHHEDLIGWWRANRCWSVALHLNCGKSIVVIVMMIVDRLKLYIYSASLCSLLCGRNWNWLNLIKIATLIICYCLLKCIWFKIHFDCFQLRLTHFSFFQLDNHLFFQHGFRR